MLHITCGRALHNVGRAPGRQTLWNAKGRIADEARAAFQDDHETAKGNKEDVSAGRAAFDVGAIESGRPLS